MRQWFKDIGFGVMGLLLGILPISGHVINAYTAAQVQGAQIKAKVETLEAGQAEILRAIKEIREKRDTDK